MRENVLAAWFHYGQKQDPCPVYLNQSVLYNSRLSPYGDFANSIGSVCREPTAGRSGNRGRPLQASIFVPETSGGLLRAKHADGKPSAEVIRERPDRARRDAFSLK